MSMRAEARWNDKAGYWQINVQVNGARRTFRNREEGKKGKRLCEAAARKWAQDSAGKSTIHTRDYRVGELWEEYLAHVQASDVGTDQKEQTEQYGRLYILPKCQHKRISTMSRKAWQNVIDSTFKERRYYKSGKEKPPLARKTMDKLRGFIVNFCTYLVKDMELLTRNDIPMLDLPKAAKAVERTVLQPEHVRTLFSSSRYVYRSKLEECPYIHAFRFLVASGLRPGELFGLRNEDITDTHKTIQRAINVHKEETEGKTDRAHRESMLTELEKKILRDQAEMLREHGIISPWVFPGKDGKPLSYRTFLRAWDTYKESNGLPKNCNLYYVRHTMASINKALPDSLLKPILGHSKTMDTDRVYKHALEGEAELAKSQIDENFRKILEG